MKLLFRIEVGGESGYAEPDDLAGKTEGRKRREIYATATDGAVVLRLLVFLDQLLVTFLLLFPFLL